MASSDTETLIEFYGRAETGPLLMDFATEAGGDPDAYGIDDVDTVSRGGFASALHCAWRRVLHGGFP